LDKPEKSAKASQSQQEQAVKERIAAGGALERPDYALQVFFSADEIDY
jgi:hypothetical protein